MRLRRPGWWSTPFSRHTARAALTSDAVGGRRRRTQSSPEPAVGTIPAPRWHPDHDVFSADQAVEADGGNGGRGHREPKAMRSGKLVIAEGGGPTAVINQSLAGAVLEARLFPQIERIYGARYGVRGIANEDFVDLSAESRANLEAIAATPSSALGSTRDKPDLPYCRNILASLKAHDASWFLYIGGNDTAETVRIVSEEAAREHYDLRSIHIPKTIDNDLMENDHAPGFPSAARFVAQAFMGRPRQSRAAGRLRRGRDGPQCRLPDRRIGRRTDSRGRRSASDLSARARLR